MAHHEIKLHTIWPTPPLLQNTCAKGIPTNTCVLYIYASMLVQKVQLEKCHPMPATALFQLIKLQQGGCQGAKH